MIYARVVNRGRRVYVVVMRKKDREIKRMSEKRNLYKTLLGLRPHLFSSPLPHKVANFLHESQPLPSSQTLPLWLCKKLGKSIFYISLIQMTSNDCNSHYPSHVSRSPFHPFFLQPPRPPKRRTRPSGSRSLKSISLPRKLHRTTCRHLDAA